MAFNRKKLAFYFSLLVVIGISDIAMAKPPVIIEFFGKNNCATDAVVQEELYKILQTQEDIILINCRTRGSEKKAVNTFSHQFCTDRYNRYNKKFAGSFRFRSYVPLIANGRWDASYNDIMPAIDLGRTDGLQKIAISLENDALNISFPDIKSNVGFGDIIVYAYATTKGEKSVFVDPDVELTEDMKEKIQDKKTVPFVTEVRTTPLYLRPVLAMQNIGRWNGENMDINFPLNDLTSMAGASYADLSYVVVLYEGGDFGNILAAGEKISLKEFNNTLPHSKPVEIQLMSPDLSKAR